MPTWIHFLYLQAEQVLLDSVITQLPPVARQNKDPTNIIYEASRFANVKIVSFSEVTVFANIGIK